MESNVTDSVWKEIPAILLENSKYQAIILPQYGANCISLVHIPTGASFFRIPVDAHLSPADANVYGLPLLFPPNRIQDGHFVFNGNNYEFPINEPARHHHIHGFLSSTPFVHLGGGVFRYSANKENPYLCFPHSFDIERRYFLKADGLHHSIKVTNHSNSSMPCGIGIHAAWNTSFFSNVSDVDCCLQCYALCRWVHNPTTIIPTGESLDNTEDVLSLRRGTLPVSGISISALYEIDPSCPVSLHTPNGRFDCFMPDTRFLMLWNGGGNKRFICPEPQSWLVNAPNLPLDPKTSGFFALKPNQSVSYRFVYTFKPI